MIKQNLIVATVKIVGAPMKTNYPKHDCEEEQCNCVTTFDDCACCQEGDCNCSDCDNCAEYETAPDLTQDNQNNKNK